MTATDAALKKSFNPYETDLSDFERAYRKALACGLEAVLDKGASSLSEIVSALNEHNVPDSSGRRWTEASLETELARLAW